MGTFKLIFLTGASGSGKGHFRQNFLPSIYSLKSMTTRAKREGEVEGNEYFFRSVENLQKEPKVTYLEITKDWLYGVPESEILTHQNQHLIYDVMQAAYIRQMIDWCEEKNLKYDYRILYFLPKNADEATQIMKSRNISETEVSIKVRLKRDTSLNSYKKYNVYPNYVLNNYDY
ncbi:MAG: hypothetical protein JXR30_02260, partial [Alphaproteobacteria bacterium]|nr:hypothetical protein [Alphaproteobacteria bacterium]